MCEDLDIANERGDPSIVLPIPVLPIFNFSLIVDPNDPLFEDEIKASKIKFNRLFTRHMNYFVE